MQITEVLTADKHGGSRSIEFTWQAFYSVRVHVCVCLCVCAEEASSSKGRNGNFEPQWCRPELDPSGNTEPDQYVYTHPSLTHLLLFSAVFSFVTPPTPEAPPLRAAFFSFQAAVAFSSL